MRWRLRTLVCVHWEIGSEREREREHCLCWGSEWRPLTASNVIEKWIVYCDWVKIAHIDLQYRKPTNNIHSNQRKDEHKRMHEETHTHTHQLYGLTECEEDNKNHRCITVFPHFLAISWFICVDWFHVCFRCSGFLDALFPFRRTMSANINTNYRWSSATVRPNVKNALNDFIYDGRFNTRKSFNGVFGWVCPRKCGITVNLKFRTVIIITNGFGHF